DVAWDRNLSKAGVCTVDNNDERQIKLFGNTCYTHYLTNLEFTDENFVVEFESTVTKTDYNYYIGLINELYTTSNNCGCCNPPNAYYIRCDGTVHINSVNDNTSFNFQNSNKTIIGMRVMLSEKQIWFY